MYDGERLHGVLVSVWLQVCAVLIYLFLVCGGFLGVSAIKNRLPRKRHRFHPWVEKIPWERNWQTTPVYLPGKSHGQRSLLGYSSFCEFIHSFQWPQWAQGSGLHSRKKEQFWMPAQRMAGASQNASWWWFSDGKMLQDFSQLSHHNWLESYFVGGVRV